MIQLKKYCIILITLLALSCSGSSNEATEEAEETMEEALYCCTNHDPSHCGTSDDLEDLTDEHGCSGFE